MSQSKVVGSITAGGATAASLPVTGSPVVAIMIAGAVMVIGGLLMVRAARFQGAAQPSPAQRPTA
jgi:LPXTG-motif cell wall-anchored protein